MNNFHIAIPNTEYAFNNVKKYTIPKQFEAISSFYLRLFMKISIGTNIKEGPWGGGNLFAINLKKYLEDKGHVVTNDLKDKDIDLILITEPRKTSESSAFTQIDVLKYLSFVKKDTIVVHRLMSVMKEKAQIMSTNI